MLARRVVEKAEVMQNVRVQSREKKKEYNVQGCTKGLMRPMAPVCRHLGAAGMRASDGGVGTSS